VSGIVIDERGASAAYVVLAVCAVLAAALTVAGTPRLGQALAAAESAVAQDGDAAEHSVPDPS
jgi:hypothetical protein